MAIREFTLDDVRRILLAAAGAGEGVDLDADIRDRSFGDLGYDSIALLEAGGRIEIEWGITLDDAALTDAVTPDALVLLVNSHLAALAV
ncbi:acyl carrier protein [Kitasatospora sp. NPDC096077]|uniref:acyl carrier protein n=1 Tax=Kitasatospora sp. NPDC096077 TaxID=3155544 RepID=UPI003323779B